MKLSVMLFPFHAALLNHSLTPRHLIQQLAEHGAQAVETMHDLAMRDPDLFQTLLEEARNANLKVACHDIELNLIASGEQREQRIHQAVERIRFARETVQTDLILLYGSQCPQELSMQAGRDIYAENLKTIAEYADILGVTTTIEDFDGTPQLACKAMHCRDILLRAQPLPAMTFDTGNFYHAGDTPQKAYPILKSFIRHVHIKDLQLSPQGTLMPTPIGQGGVPFKELCQNLRRDNYRGALSIEIHTHELQDALKALDFMKTCA